MLRRKIFPQKSIRRLTRAPTSNMGAPATGENFFQKVRMLPAGAKVCVARKLGGIGDILMITPGLRELKRTYPYLDLTFAIDMQTTDSYRLLLEGLSFIDHVVNERETTKKQYDAYVDITTPCIRYEHSGLPPLNRIDIFARAIGVYRLSDTLPAYNLRQDEIRWARGEIKRLQETSSHSQENKLVFLHTASFDERRTWPAHKYSELMQKAESAAPHITFLVSDFNHKLKDIKQHPNAIDVTQSNVRKLAAIISQADLFIGPDSGPMHLAGALKIPSIVMFGSIPPEVRINYYPTHEAITKQGLACLGCFYKPCKYSFKCMTQLDSDIVFERMLARLQ